MSYSTIEEKKEFFLYSNKLYELPSSSTHLRPPSNVKVYNADGSIAKTTGMLKWVDITNETLQLEASNELLMTRRQEREKELDELMGKEVESLLDECSEYTRVEDLKKVASTSQALETNHASNNQDKSHSTPSSKRKVSFDLTRNTVHQIPCHSTHLELLQKSKGTEVDRSSGSSITKHNENETSLLNSQVDPTYEEKKGSEVRLKELTAKKEKIEKALGNVKNLPIIERKARETLESLERYGSLEGPRFLVEKEISEGKFNEKNLQTLLEHLKEVRNTYFFGKINEQLEKIKPFISEKLFIEKLGEVFTKYQPKKLDEQDLEKIEKYAEKIFKNITEKDSNVAAGPTLVYLPYKKFEVAEFNNRQDIESTSTRSMSRTPR